MRPISSEIAGRVIEVIPRDNDRVSKDQLLFRIDNEPYRIALAKAEIFGGLPEGGTAIIPHDNPHADLLARAAADTGAKVVRFGIGRISTEYGA